MPRYIKIESMMFLYTTGRFVLCRNGCSRSGDLYLRLTYGRGNKSGFLSASCHCAVIGQCVECSLGAVLRTWTH